MYYNNGYQQPMYGYQQPQQMYQQSRMDFLQSMQPQPSGIQARPVTGREEAVAATVFPGSPVLFLDRAHGANALYAYVIGKSKDKIIEELKNIGSLELFSEIEMPVAEILAEMQIEGIYLDQKELIKYGETLKKHIEELRIDI